MNKLSRLTALLLAVMLMFSVTASALELQAGIPLAKMDAAAYAALVESASARNTLSYPCEEKPEYCLFSEYSLMTASELYDYFNEMYAEDGDGEISVRYSAVMLHYAEYHLDSNLICTCGEHPLPLPDYQVGDISVHEDTCPWHFANLTVPEQYGMVRMMSFSARAPYIATLSDEQASELDTYAEEQGGYVDSVTGCDGSTCGYNAFVALNGFDRYDKLVKWLNVESPDMDNYYNVFIGHLTEAHPDADELCLCIMFASEPEKYAYGSLNHRTTLDLNNQQIECPWHFKYLSTEDQYTVVKDMSSNELANYTVSLSQEQFKNLMAYIQSQNINKPSGEITSEGTTAKVDVPEGAFAADYIMNTAQSVINEAKQAALNLLGRLNILAAFDISFSDANDSSVKLQPVSGKTVGLTFTVDTSAVEGNVLRIIHLKQNADGSYTAEVAATFAVDRSAAVQTLPVQAGEFSDWLVDTQCDGEACGFNTYAALTSDLARYAYLTSLYDDEGTDLEAFLSHLYIVHTDALAYTCTCTGDPLVYAPGSTAHDEGCAWNSSAVASPSGQEFLDVYNTLNVFDRAYYLRGLDENQLAAMKAGMTVEELEEMGQLDDDLIAWLQREDVNAWRATHTISDEVILLAAAKTMDGTVPLNEAIALNSLNQLLWLYESQVLAELNTLTGELIDVRYHIPVAKLVDGLIYPLENTTTN